MSDLSAEATKSDGAAPPLDVDQTPHKDNDASEVKEKIPTEEINAEINANTSISKPKITEDDHKEVDCKTSSTDSCPEQQGSENLEKPTDIHPEGALKTSAPAEGVSNSKYDPSILPTTDDPVKIRAQVEFYFGDANLPTDKYMWGLTEGSANVPVPIKKICVFGRMRRFSPYSAVVSALKESSFLDVTGEEGEEVVKRKVAFDPDAPCNKAESRSIYAKGFGEEEPSSQFDIEAFFAPHGPTNAVRLRRTPKKLFKGSVFVEFADEETAQKFLNLPTKPLWKGVHELKVMSKKAYTDLKMEEIKSGKIEPSGRDHWLQGRGRGRGNFRGAARGGRGNFHGRKGDNRDPNDWKKRRDEDRASGFKDDRNRNNGNKGGRGRGHGRGEERRGRHGKGRKNDRNREHDNNNGTHAEGNNVENGKSQETQKHPEGSATVQAADAKVDVVPNQNSEPHTKSSPSKKRMREDDDAGQGASKKIDTKVEVPVEA